MNRLGRRAFLAACSASALPLRASPLARIPRENLKITDIRVTLLSHELPREKQWVTASFVVWKADAILVEVLTDKGIIGIGEPSPYGGPE
ncbi:MAG TPA: hypothetical protein VLE22_16790, partial [Bryobacteraceae bacterium]|nr:hypothetical protein [Bryobacteraceae bacterium]